MKSKAFQHPMGKVWHELAEVMGDQATRFDRMEGDVAVLKTDVAVLKTDVAVLKTDVAVLKTDVAVLNERVNRMDLAIEQRFNRIDGKLDQLMGLIIRDEMKHS